MHKKKVVVLIDWYLPAYKAGGPIQSVANIISRLKEDFDFAVITSNCDLDGPYSSVQADEWTIAPDGTRTYYFSNEHFSLKKMKEVILKEQADYLYMNSLFSFRFTLIPLYIRKVHLPMRKTLLAPRGMLGKGALEIKALKKKSFLLLSKIAGLYKNINWHVSTELEAAEVRHHFGKSSKVKIAGNLSALTSRSRPHLEKVHRQASFVFISRIAAKKNLLPFINALQSLNPVNRVVFDIYGPVDEEDYWQECLRSIGKSSDNVLIGYKGPVENSLVNSVFQRYHFSVLYTLHENFGHSIIEGMAAGCPAIVSDQTPWRKLAEKKAGWDIPVNDENQLAEIVDYCCKMKQEEYDEWSLGARTFAETVINNPETVEANKSLFE